MANKIRVAQISDCHLFSDPNLKLQNLNTDDNLISVLKMIEEDNNFDFLLLSGDIANDGEVLAYQRLVRQIEQLQTPCYYVPGNHDNLANLQNYLVGKYLHNEKYFKLGDWQFILLNSAKPNYTEGYLAEDELAFLSKCLADKNLFTVIVMHHHPLDSQSFMDEIKLVNADMFFNIIDNFEKVRAVLFGHLHQVMEELRHNVLFLSAPATAYQIKPRTQQLIVDALTPGYRWLEFEYNGNIKTGISRLPMSKANVTN